MSWNVVFIPQAEEDLRQLDNSQRIQVLKAIAKVSANPLPYTEGGYGKPLGNHLTSNLSGFLKIKLLKLGLRVVYRLVEDKGQMRIIVISVRDDSTVYKLTQERMK